MEIQGLLETARENSDAFKKIWQETDSPESFLHRTTSLKLRDCTLTAAEQLLWTQVETDVDGIVSTFDRFCDIIGPVSYFNILPRKEKSLLPVFPIIRKHVRLYEFNEKGLSYLRWSVSTKLFDCNGYQFHLVLLPISGERKWRNMTRDQVRSAQYQYYDHFRRRISCIIQDLPQDDICRSTIKKNKFFDIRTLHILPDDKDFMMAIFDKALSETVRPNSFEPKIVCFTFGDRNSREVALDMVNPVNALTSVHVAARIGSFAVNDHLFWSRQGLQQLIGTRGMLLSALSLSECGNFQSNLDGRRMDVPDEMLRLCLFPSEINFIQFYADTPNMIEQSIHPVYKTIVSSGLNDRNTQSSLEQHAYEYIETAKENVLKLCRVKCRIELVCYTKREYHSVSACEYLSLHHLSDLLKKYSLIVPIADTELGGNCHSFMSAVKSVGRHIVCRLEELLTTHKHIGGFLASWEAYQLEVANEMLWKGKPNAGIDNRYAVNLGPGGAMPSRCSTWERGFMCLEDATICALDVRSTPPLIGIVTWNASESRRIQRLFNFSDLLNTSDSVLGSRTLLLLLSDILEDPMRTANCDRSFISDLKKTECPDWGRLSGTITVERVCDELGVKERFKRPYTFGRALTMIESRDRNARDILKTGMRNLKLRFFPDARFTDNQKNTKFHWPTNNVLKIIEDGIETSITDDASLMTLNVIRLLESLELVHTSKLNVNRDDSFLFPWLPDVLLKLEGTYFDNTLLSKLATYITCIALLENHWFVDFNKLHKLYNFMNRKVNNFQAFLQSKMILSPFRLPCILVFCAYRLHVSVPVYFAEKDSGRDMDKSTKDTIDASEDSVPKNDVERSQIEHQLEHENMIVRANRRRASAGFLGKWTAVEIECLDRVLNANLHNTKESYHLYQRYCDEADIPDRTFVAFKTKYYRLQR